jgi:uncharacterized membrane protein YbhN (UPF0104 family)
MTRAIFYAKLIAGVGLLALLFHFGAVNAGDLVTVFAHPVRLAGAVALVFLMMPVSAYRWKLLLEAQGIVITIRYALELTLVAGFFNVFLLGGIGGDGVRLLMAARTLDGPFSRVAASAAVDRIFGLEALLMVAALSCLWRLPTLASTAVLSHLAQLVGLAAGGGLLSLLVLLYLGDQPLVATALARLAKFGRLGSFLAQLCENLTLYRRYPATLCKALALSLASHACMVSAFTLFAAPSGSTLTLWDYGFALSVTQAVSCFALIPGALGIAEALFGYLTALLAHGEMTLSSSFFGFRAVIALATAPGALVWLGSPSRRTK